MSRSILCPEQTFSPASDLFEIICHKPVYLVTMTQGDKPKSLRTTVFQHSYVDLPAGSVIQGRTTRKSQEATTTTLQRQGQVSSARCISCAGGTSRDGCGARPARLGPALRTGRTDGRHGRSRGLPAPQTPIRGAAPARGAERPGGRGHSPLLSCCPRAAGAAVPRRAAGGERQSQRSCRNWLRHSWRPRRAPSRIAGISSGFCSHSSCCRRLSGGLAQPGLSGPPAAAMPSHLRRQRPSAQGPDGREGTGSAPLPP